MFRPYLPVPKQFRSELPRLLRHQKWQWRHLTPARNAVASPKAATKGRGALAATTKLLYLNLHCEVYVARRVNEVNVMIGPLEGNGSGVNGDAALAF